MTEEKRLMFTHTSLRQHTKLVIIQTYTQINLLKIYLIETTKTNGPMVCWFMCNSKVLYYYFRSSGLVSRRRTKDVGLYFEKEQRYDYQCDLILTGLCKKERVLPKVNYVRFGKWNRLRNRKFSLVLLLKLEPTWSYPLRLELNITLFTRISSKITDVSRQTVRKESNVDFLMYTVRIEVDLNDGRYFCKVII